MYQVLDYENDFIIAIKTSVNKLPIKPKQLANNGTLLRKYIMYKGKTSENFLTKKHGLYEVNSEIIDLKVVWIPQVNDQ